MGITEPGSVLLIVLGGDRGDGFACQADIVTTEALLYILEGMAKQIRESGGV